MIIAGVEISRLKKLSGSVHRNFMETIIPKRWTSLVLVAVVAFLSAVSFSGSTDETQGASATTFRAVYDVRQYGASGDGKRLDTQAVQEAIDACSGSGGGMVYFPDGTYLTGTVILKSHVTLHLEPGATILGSTSLKDYDPPYLIYADKAQNIAITGRGVIDGQGEFFWDENFRPLERCRNVLISGGQALPGTGTFLRLAGSRTGSVSLIGNDLSEAKKAFVLARDIRRKAFYRSANRLPD